jgi:hypothetical protein
MINLMVANYQQGRKATIADLQTYLRAQIDNSKTFGWAPSSIVVMSNFPFAYDGIKARELPLNRHCLTGSKVFATAEFLETIGRDSVVWCHDLDAWQNAEFTAPAFAEIGICCYSTPKYNGGSVFYRAGAVDAVRAVRDEILQSGIEQEEPVLNDVFRRAEYAESVTVLNSTFNVGCSGFGERYARSEKPIRCLHFHPTNRIAWDMHARDRYGITNGSTVSVELRAALLKYFGETIRGFRYNDGADPLAVRLHTRRAAVKAKR